MARRRDRARVALGTLKEKITGVNKKVMTTIFIDMDGVVADFGGYALRTLGIESKPGLRFDQTDWHRLREHSERIYSIVPVLPSAYKFVSGLKCVRDKFRVDLRFLTAVPKENDLGWAFWDKMQWASKHFPGIPVWFGPYSADKQYHCKPGDILIDDRISNIKQWPEHGILHQGDHEITLNTVEQILRNKS